MRRCAGQHVQAQVHVMASRRKAADESGGGRAVGAAGHQRELASILARDLELPARLYLRLSTHCWVPAVANGRSKPAPGPLLAWALLADGRIRSRPPLHLGHCALQLAY